MPMTSADQLKDKIKNLANSLKIEPQILLRTYMMERFLERMANSKYKGDFILKGGLLLAATFGQNQRKTMDIDVTLKNQRLEKDLFENIIDDIVKIDISDHAILKLKDIKEIREESIYPRLRVSLEVELYKIKMPIKIDITVGDKITPKEISYQYPLLLENKTINIPSYNIETILAEKMESILVRSDQNTRMKDFYDIYLLVNSGKIIDYKLFQIALRNTAENRKTLALLEKNTRKYIKIIENSVDLKNLWQGYVYKNSYAANITYEDTIKQIKVVCEKGRLSRLKYLTAEISK